MMMMLLMLVVLIMTMKKVTVMRMIKVNDELISIHSLPSIGLTFHQSTWDWASLRPSLASIRSLF